MGYAFTVAGLLVPLAPPARDARWGGTFAGFGLLGIGNTAIQVAVNPLLATIVPAERMTSYLTVGQIFRNTSPLLLAPIVTALVAATGFVASAAADLRGAHGAGRGLAATYHRGRTRTQRNMRRTGSLLRAAEEQAVLLCTLGVACFIAADVGDRVPLGAADRQPRSILTTTGFYACRIVGTIVGAWGWCASGTRNT